MGKKKEIWIVEFEKPDDYLMYSMEYGLIGVDEDGIVNWVYKDKKILLKWKVIKKKVVK